MQPGTNWGGEYSRWTFDELKQYMMVAKEYLIPGTDIGVPLLDSELNENAEILLTLLRRVIQRAVGDGTEGTGFKIVQSAANPTNNFTINGGDGTPDGAGHIFVSGWMCLNPYSLEYTGQPGVNALSTPSGGDREDHVYIDIYLDEVGPTDDGDIVDSGVGFETSRRIKLKWTVKVAEGQGAPTHYTDAENRKHWTFQLATLNREDGNPQITTDMISDNRRLVMAARSGEYVHIQGTPAAVWTVNHQLSASYPTVAVYDGSGQQVTPGGISIDSNDQITIDFDGTAVSGFAVVKVLINL